MIKDVRYRIAFALLKGGDCYHGQVEIQFTANHITEDTFLDYKGRLIKWYSINGREVERQDTYHDHQLILPKEYLKMGENIVVVRFVSNYVRDCQGLHYFKD